MPGVAEGFLAGRQLDVVVDHHRGQLLDAGLGDPAELLLGLGGVAQQQVDLRRTEVAGVELDVVLDVQSRVRPSVVLVPLATAVSGMIV